MHGHAKPASFHSSPQEAMKAPAEEFLAGFERLAEDADGRVTVYRLRPR